MRDPKRIPVIMAELQRLWEMVPDLRLGQLIVAGNGNRDPFFIEDDVLLLRVRTLVDNGQSIAREKTDARLIAVAPEMAEALRTLVQQSHAATCEGEFHLLDGSAIQAGMDVLRRAGIEPFPDAQGGADE